MTREEKIAGATMNLTQAKLEYDDDVTEFLAAINTAAKFRHLPPDYKSNKEAPK